MGGRGKDGGVPRCTGLRVREVPMDAVEGTGCWVQRVVWQFRSEWQQAQAVPERMSKEWMAEWITDDRPEPVALCPLLYLRNTGGHLPLPARRPMGCRRSCRAL